jgi:hypothetical protein
LYPATQLGLHIGAAVVQDGALGVDIKLAVDVAADPGGAGRLDVDPGDIVGRGDDLGLLVTGSNGIGPDLGLGRHRREPC